jgi:hypothetical protein
MNEMNICDVNIGRLLSPANNKSIRFDRIRRCFQVDSQGQKVEPSHIVVKPWKA